MRVRSVHQVLGLWLAVPFLVWTATGLLFLVKPGWRGAYEQLQAFQETGIDSERLAPLPAAVAAAQETLDTPAELHRVELGATAIGPLYRLFFTSPAGPTTVVVDGHSGAVRSPLLEEEAVALAADAAGRAAASSRYGAVVASRGEGEKVEVTFAGGAVVALDRGNLAVTQRGSDTAWIDALYRLHYLRWTGFSRFDQIVVLVAIVGTWSLVVLGLWLSRRKRQA